MEERWLIGSGFYFLMKMQYMDDKEICWSILVDSVNKLNQALAESGSLPYSIVISKKVGCTVSLFLNNYVYRLHLVLNIL